MWSSLLRVCPRDNSIKLMEVMVFLVQSLTAGLTLLSSLPYKSNIAFPFFLGMAVPRPKHCTKYRIPLYDPEKQPFFDWLVLYRDWYDICGFRFSADMQKRNLVSTQPVDQQEVLGEQLRREKLTFQQLWHIVSAFAMRVSNPYVAKRVCKALQLEGDVGPEEWYQFLHALLDMDVRCGVA